MAFAFAQQQMFAEEQIAARDSTLRICLAHVVKVDSALLDVFAGLAFRWAEHRLDENIDEGLAFAP